MAKQKQTARRVRTLKAVAEHFGVAAPTAGAWRRKPGFPVHTTSDGKAEYDLDEITLWLQRRPKQFLQARQGAPLGGSLRGPREGSPAEREHRGTGGPSSTEPEGSNSTYDQLAAAARFNKEVEQLELRKRRADAELAEIKAETAKGTVVRREKLVSGIQGIAAMCRRVLGQMTERARAQWGDECAERVQTLVDESWKQIAGVQARLLEEQPSDD